MSYEEKQHPANHTWEEIYCISNLVPESIWSQNQELAVWGDRKLPNLWFRNDPFFQMNVSDSSRNSERSLHSPYSILQVHKPTLQPICANTTLIIHALNKADIRSAGISSPGINCRLSGNQVCLPSSQFWGIHHPYWGGGRKSAWQQLLSYLRLLYSHPHLQHVTPHPSTARLLHKLHRFLPVWCRKYSKALLKHILLI